MARYSITLTANKEQWFPYAGRVLQLVDLGAATSVALAIGWSNAQDAESLGNVTTLFKVKADRGFKGFLLTSTVGATIDVLVADDDAGFPDTNQVQIVTSQLPLPVETRNANDLAATSSNPAAVAITAAGQQIMAANVNARRVVLRNSGGSPVGISRGAGAAFADCAAVIQPGDVWIEDRFAGTNQAWRGICAAGLSSTIAVEVTA